jgi:hypothetical protein
VNDDSSIVNKLETLLIDDTRAIIYDHHMFIVQATGYPAARLDSFVNKIKFKRNRETV